MLEKLRLAGAITLLLGVFGGAAGVTHVVAAPADQAGGKTWTVLTGGEAEVEQSDLGPAGAWQFERFYPESITINVGDTVDWKINAAEFHTVNFPAPGKKDVPFTSLENGDLVANPEAAFPSGGPTYDGSGPAGSGLLGKDPTQGQKPEYKLTFTKAGTYQYVCAIHSAINPATGQVVGMTGTVVVQAAGTAYPQTQAQIDNAANSAIAADSQAALAAEAKVKQVAPPQVGANGATTYSANVGLDAQVAATLASYMRFAPRDIVIHVGDTITWNQTSAITPHTVTLTSGQKEPETIIAQPQQGGPPRLILNPQILAPAGGNTYNGTGYVNSGFMPGLTDTTPGPRTFSLTFTQPGTYEYICALHDQLGMNGHITVLAAGETPGMPRTGSSDYTLWLVSGLGSLGMVLVAGGFVLRFYWRRKRVTV